VSQPLESRSGLVVGCGLVFHTCERIVILIGEMLQVEILENGEEILQ